MYVGTLSCTSVGGVLWAVGGVLRAVGGVLRAVGGVLWAVGGVLWAACGVLRAVGEVPWAVIEDPWKVRGLISVVSVVVSVGSSVWIEQPEDRQSLYAFRPACLFTSILV